jgi:hypothetical protein
MSTQNVTETGNAADSKTPLLTLTYSLIGLVTLSLLLLATYLVFRMNLFSSKTLSDEQFKSLWAFLGVALGAVATLIGAMLTDQSNRRDVALRALAAAQQDATNRETEKRLKLDTVAKVLELITNGDNYAPPARVAGAVATMVELRGGPVAIRMLRELWVADKVSTSTAVWLVDRVLTDPETQEDAKLAAADLLADYASKLVPAPGDATQERYEWPSILQDSWPAHLSDASRNSLFHLTRMVLLARKPDFWWERGTVFPVKTLHTLVFLTNDTKNEEQAALLLSVLFKAGFLEDIDFPLNEPQVARITQLADASDPAPWFAREMDRVRQWAEVRKPQPAPPS